MKKRLVFFGNERIATGLDTDTPIIKSLIDDGYEIEAIIANHNASGSSRKNRDLEIQDTATHHDIPLFLPTSSKDLNDVVSSLTSDIAVLVAYGRIIPQSVIEQFPLGIINVHPSLLPLHRGPTPIESAILNGDAKTGVSIMQLSAKMDAGPVYKQSSLELNRNESKRALADALVEQSISLLLGTLEDILNGTARPSQQDDSQATYDRLIDKPDGIIDWGKSAEVLEQEIRAYAVWPRSKTTLGGINMAITGASVVQSNKPESKPGDIQVISGESPALIIKCGHDSLRLENVLPAGKKEMPVAAFLSGYKSRLV